MIIKILPSDYTNSNYSNPCTCAVANALKRSGFHANVYCRKDSEGIWGELCFYGGSDADGLVIPLTEDEALLVHDERKYKDTGYSIDFSGLDALANQWFANDSLSEKCL